MKHYLRFMLVLLLSTVWCVGGYSQETATLKFTKACGGKGLDDKKGSWVITSDAKESTFDSSKGIHYGTNSNSVSYLKATTTSYSNYNITKIVVNASAANNGSPKVNCQVGGQAFGKEQDLTKTNVAYTFEGNAKGDIVVSISKSKTKKALYLLSVEITYESGVATTITFPEESFSFATTDDLTSFTGQKATLKAEGADLTGKAITYSKAGDDIFTSFDGTTGVLALNGNAGTATVTAKFAGDDTYTSSFKSYIISVKSVVKDIATLKPLITSSNANNPQSFTLKLTDAIVTYVNRNTAYVQDATAGIYIYASNHNLENNQKINGLVDVKACLFKDLPEITTWTLWSGADVTADATFDIETVTLAELTANYSKYESKPVKVAGAVVTKAFDNNNGEINQNGTSYVVYNKGGADVTITEGDNIDIIGYPAIYNGTKQLNLWKQSNVTVNYSQVATSLSLDPATTEYIVEKGKENDFKAPTVIVTDANNEVVADAKITYKSSNTEVTTVAEDGTVYFVGFGTTTITASYVGDATHKAAQDVSYTIVYRKVPTQMTWSAEAATANIGQEFTAPILSLTADNVSILEGKTITYTSTDENVAMVDENGKVVLKDKEGTTTITATFAGDDTYAEASASYTLTVVDPNKREVTFDFVNNKYGHGADGKEQVSEGEKFTSEDVTITHVKNGTQSKTAFYDDSFRVYYGSQLNISVAAGYYMTKIEFDNIKDNTFECTPGKLNGNVWEGTASSIDLFVNGNNQFKTITVSYAKCPEVVVDENATQDEMSDLILNNGNKVVNAKLNRTLEADGGWYTFSVPFDVKDVNSTALSEAEIRKYKTMNGSIMEFEATKELKAGHAYLVKPLVDITTPIFKSVTLYKGDNLKDGENGYEFIATLGSTELKTDGTNLFLGAENKFYIPTGTDKIMKALRGYFEAPSKESGSKMGINIDGETNYITTLNGSAVVYGKVYNLNGQYVGNDVKSLKKGVYVVNGRKFIVK